MKKSIHNKTLALSAAAALIAGLASASVFDGARVWFRGGYDVNNDGVFSANEFSDSARPKSDTAHQTVTISGSGAAYGKGAVWSSFNPFYTNTQYYVSFPNGDRTASSACTAFNLVNPVASGESWSQFTIFIRFRWDGKFAPDNDNKLYVLDTGLNWNGKRGIWFGFKYFPETDDFAPFCYAGQSSDVPSATKGIKIPVGEWQDIMITVYDRGVGSYASINLYMGSEGVVTNPGGLWPGLSDADSGKTKRVRLESTDAIRIGYTAFSGDIAEWALWPKVLTYDEVREAFGALRPGDALFRIGKEDGKSDEFAAAGNRQYAVDANGTWDVVPSVLDETHDTLSIDFEVPQSWETMNQSLRLVAASGDGWIEGVVVDKQRPAKTATLKKRYLRPGHAADFFVPADALRVGPHTLTLRLTSGTSVEFDVIELRGSFCLGQIDYNMYPNKQFMATATNGGNSLTYYDIATGYWRAMDGGISKDTIHDPEDANYDPDSVAALTVFFDVPAELVSCSNRLHISYNQIKDNPSAVYGYLNSSLIYDSTIAADGKEYNFEVVPLDIPADTFVAGRNSFRMRWTNPEGIGWWGGIRGLRIEIQDGPPPDKTGMVIIVR